MLKQIDIDCPPGDPRPGDLLPAVLKGTGIPEKEPILTFFGNWSWDYEEVSDEVWVAATPVIKERLTALYHKGWIRYASWGNTDTDLAETDAGS